MDAESLARVERVAASATEGLRGDLAEVRQDLAEATAGLQQQITEVRQDLAQATGGLQQQITDLRRHTGVLVEDLRRDVQLVAEGIQIRVERRHAEDREYFDQQFRETRALFHLSFEQLQQRVEGLERRVRHIEEHLGLTA